MSTASLQQYLIFLDKNRNLVTVSYSLHTPLDPSAINNTPLLLNNGAALNNACWNKDFINSLATYRPVVCKEHRGEGGALLDGRIDYPNIPNLNNSQILLTEEDKIKYGFELPLDYSLVDSADDAIKLMTTLFPNHSKFHFGGLSQGGMITQLIAVYYPEYCKSICLLGTTSDAVSGMGVDSGSSLIDVKKQLLMRTSASTLPQTEADKQFVNIMEGVSLLPLVMPEKCWGKALLAKPEAKKIIEESIPILPRRSLHSISSHVASCFIHHLAAHPLYHKKLSAEIPFLIIHGEADPIFDHNSTIAEYKSVLPDAKIISIEEAGHIVCAEPIAKAITIEAMNEFMNT